MSFASTDLNNQSLTPPLKPRPITSYPLLVNYPPARMLRSTLVAVALTFSHVEGVTYRLVETNHGLTFFVSLDLP